MNRPYAFWPIGWWSCLWSIVYLIAPTGTISLIAGCNGGIEPVFSIVFERKALDGEKFIEINPLVEELGIQQGWLSKKVRDLLC